MVNKKKPNDCLTKRYTPIPIHDSNYMNLLVKVYNPNEKFPEGGRVSQYLDSIKLGESIKIKYPYGKVNYLGNGNFIFKLE
jgi:hypothetical protein